MATKPYLLLVAIFILLLSFAPLNVSAETPHCGEEITSCHNKAEALKIKYIAIASILVMSMIGVCFPVYSNKVKALQPDTNLFVIVKAFASGVILATGYMHVLPDSFNDLASQCLPQKPWRNFPFTTFVAMLSAVVCMMIDSFSMSRYRKSFLRATGNGVVMKIEEGINTKEEQLMRYRVVAKVLETGIVVHSVVIGLSMGSSQNPCTIRPLIAAICFHQLFEGMGLGGCILQAEFKSKMKLIMVFFFSCTTPFGIGLGIALNSVYSDNSPNSLIVEGLLNACSAGLLNYMALVDLLAADFMGSKLQGNMKLQVWSYIAVLLGAGGMSVMAIWA
ncbi:PREDICTED: fe(2+) transport protein 1-like [Fragaria vesca subsp. vesca]|uniref:fe(2+) transport protein 1-like n=1 Tax=Fragaria vesca subsp. vesca TaxID=101020 RepID=UPI0002C306D6|nr:PREDICTED: fe(2+) transport protein 1-like [Fragaria vesca subsp. vesca]